MTKDEKLLADLYYTSNTVKFGNFKLAAHDVDSDLALSPLYMHFPIKREAGYKLLPQIYKLVGELFHKIIVDEKIEYDRITGIPDGAKPIALDLAKRFTSWPQNLVEFSKKADSLGRRSFYGPTKGAFTAEDIVLVVEDHTSGGYSKSIFVAATKKVGLKVTDILTIVDREQGGESYLASIGIKLHSIFKLSELLDYYVKQGIIENSKAEEIRDYIKNNQIVI